MKRKHIIVASFFISLFAGFIPIGYPFSFQRTLTFLPFFVLGYYSVGIDVMSYIRKIPFWCAVMGLLIVFAILIILNYDFVHVHHGSFSYWVSDPLFLFGGRCVFIPFSIILSMLVMRLCPANHRFATWGKFTIFVYIYHSFAIEILDAFIGKRYIPQNVILLLVYAAIIVFGLLLLKEAKPFVVLLNPISNFSKLTICCKK